MLTRALRRSVYLILCGLLAPSLGPAAEVYRGPYLQMGTPTSMVIVWRTEGAIDPVVRYGASPDALNQAVSGEAVTQRVSADVAAESDAVFGSVPLLYDEPRATAAERDPRDRDPSTRPSARQFEATIDGLQPGKKYYYAVYDGERRLAGGDERHFFHTSPAHGARTDLRLWVVGDTGTGGGDQRRVFKAAQAFVDETRRPIDLYLHVGDMAYGDGADVEFQRNFFDVYQPLLRNTVCWPTMGNHEGHTSRGVSQFGPYYDAYVLPTAGEAGGTPSGTEAYYSFDVAGAHFICLDSHDLDRTPDGAMCRWLAADLEQADSDWLIAFWHHPPYTKGSHDSDRERQLIEMRTYVMPLLESGGVDIVLSGHSHIYERSMLIDGAYATPTTAEGVVLDDGDGRPEGDGAYRKSAGLRPNEGTVAIVSGHGGASISRSGTMPIMREIIIEHGSVMLDIDGDTLTGTMINSQGDQRDTFQIVKKGVVEPQIVANPWQPVHDPSQITEQQVEFAEADLGGEPSGWTRDGGRMIVEPRPGSSRLKARVTASDTPVVAAYDGFQAELGEVEAWLEFRPESQSAAGVIFGGEDANNYLALKLDPAAGVAALVRVADGEAQVVSERPVDVRFDRPIKVELETVLRTVEVQLNDELEYTVNLDHETPAGRVGVWVGPGGAVNIADIVLERDL